MAAASKHPNSMDLKEKTQAIADAAETVFAFDDVSKADPENGFIIIGWHHKQLVSCFKTAVPMDVIRRALAGAYDALPADPMAEKATLDADDMQLNAAFSDPCDAAEVKRLLAKMRDRA